MRITAVDYTTIENEDRVESVVKVTGRDEDGNRRTPYVYGTQPYMYVRSDEDIPKKHSHRVEDVDAGYETYDGIEVKKWTCRIPKDVREIKDDIEDTWESDIPYYRRCSMDYDLSGYVRIPDEWEMDISEIDTNPDVDPTDQINPRVVYGDIEVRMGENSLDETLEDADQPVLAVTLYDSYEDQYDVYSLDPPDDDEELDPAAVAGAFDDHGIDVDGSIRIHKCPTEGALLDSVLGYFEDVRPDLTTGWNWVTFDVQYLLRRIKRLHGETADEYNLDLDRFSDAGGTKRNFSSYHGDLARTMIGVPAVDMMSLFFERIEFSQWRSKSLDYVSQEVLGVGKIDDVNVNTAFEEDRSRLAAYNVIDVKLCVDIDETRDVIDTCFGLAEESQIQIYDVFSEMRLVDGYIMSRSDDDEILPDQDESDIPENAGGLVLEPSEGIHEWVGVMDLKSLYPSSIITWNISPETVHWTDDKPDTDLKVPWVPEADEISYPITDDQISWDRLGTDLDQEGIVPKYLKLLFEKREEAKAKRSEFKEGSTEYETWDRRQYGVKVIMNSFYGVSSNDYWRLATHGLGDAVTSASRYTLFKGKQIVERIGYDVRYGDTDSCFVDLTRKDPPSTDEVYKKKAVLDGKGMVSQVNSSMEEAIRESGLEGEHPYLDGSLPHDMGSHCLYWEFEKLYRRYIQFGKKKRYAGLILWKEGKDVDRVDVVGFESQRSDTPKTAAEVQEEVLHMVLDGAGFDAVSDYVSGIADDIEGQSIPMADIARPKSIGKPLHEYQTTTQTIKACQASTAQLGKTWKKGDDPFIVFLEETPTMEPKSSSIALEWGDELPDGYVIDAEEHIRISLKAPLSPILDELGWTWEEIRIGDQAGDATEIDWDTSEDDITETETDDPITEDDEEEGALTADW